MKTNCNMKEMVRRRTSNEPQNWTELFLFISCTSSYSTISQPTICCLHLSNASLFISDTLYHFEMSEKLIIYWNIHYDTQNIMFCCCVSYICTQNVLKEIRSLSKCIMCDDQFPCPVVTFGIRKNIYKHMYVRYDDMREM